MTGAPINVLQQLMRGWETQHPYNAAQVLTVGTALSLERWQAAWVQTLADTGLGCLRVHGRRYGFDTACACPPRVTLAATTLDEHLSQELAHSFADDDRPLRPFVLVRPTHCLAGLVYQHWIADSASIQQLMRIWFCLALGLPVRSSKLQLPQTGFWRSVGPGPLGWSVPLEMLRVTRQHMRLRRAAKIDGTGLDDLRTRFQTVPAPTGLIQPLRAACAARGVTLNDLFLAALLESCAKHVPLQRRVNRPDLAVGSIADLRRARGDASFGLLLGFLTAIARRRDVADFDRLLQVISRQTRQQKACGVASLSLLWLAAGAAASRLLPPSEMYHFYRKVFPLLGGLSNIDLSRTWAAAYPGLLLDYHRISPTGPMVPLVLTTTTLGERLNIGLTHRTGLLPPDGAQQIGEGFVQRLCSFAAGDVTLDPPRPTAWEESREPADEALTLG